LIKAIYCWYINNKTVIKIFVKSDENEDEGENEVFDIQTKHGLKIGGEVYRRLITESPFSIEIKQVSLRHVSKK
jgi:hypothetical protein